MPATIDSAATLLQELRKHHLLEASQFGDVSRSRFADARTLAQWLVQRGWLTPFQVNQLFQGQGASLAVGPYLLLERLGEGGMGQVFKARHLRLDRIVAVKLIRKERLEQAEAVERFRREVQAAAQLSHANVVLALDGGEAGHTLYFAMEYIEGIDLARLVRESGRLDVDVSCDYIRQAALGLQHIHEHGLVHRDIKPSNLIVSFVPGPSSLVPTGNAADLNKGPVTKDKGHIIKILDLGLARLLSKDDPAMKADSSGEMLTSRGKVIGTPEFIAPEQALNAHGADIRADLYSLGCTFYFLLAGKPPFRKGTALETLFAHRYEEPEPLELVRPDVPIEVRKVLTRLMAKKPGDRDQVPAELVSALRHIFGRKDGGSLLETGNVRSIPTLVNGNSPAGKRIASAATAGNGTANPWAGLGDDREHSPEAARRDDRVRCSRPKLARPELPHWNSSVRRWLVLTLAALGLLVGFTLLGAMGSYPWLSATSGPVPSRPAPSSLAGVAPFYRKKATREETILATLEANGVPTLQGKWYIIGPFEVLFGSPAHGLRRPFPPETEIDLVKTYPAKDNQKVAWKEATTFTVGKVVNLRGGGNYDNVCVYLLHEFEAKESLALQVSLGCDDTMNVWLNDELVASKKTGGRAEPEQVVTILKLRAGKNRLLAKVCNGTGDFGFYICPQWPERLSIPLASRLDRDFPSQPPQRDGKPGP